MEVMSGLNRACVRRLKNTWGEVGEEEKGRLEEMEELINYTFVFFFFFFFLLLFPHSSFHI